MEFKIVVPITEELQVELLSLLDELGDRANDEFESAQRDGRFSEARLFDQRRLRIEDAISSLKGVK